MRIRRPERRLLGGLLALFALVAGTAVGAEEKQLSDSASVVKASATAGKVGADGTQEVVVTLTIDEGWHTYANPVDNETLADVTTTLSFSADKKVDVVKVGYPSGKLVIDAIVGNYKVYEKKVEIKATVRRTAGDESPVQVTAKLQACNDKKCLLPASVKATTK